MNKKEENKIIEDKEIPLKYRTRFFGFKRKHIAFFFNKSGETYELYGRQRIKAKGEIIIKFKGKSFLFSIGNCSFSEGIKDFYAFDLTSGKQLFFEGQKVAQVPSEIVDLVINNNFFKAVLSSIAARFGLNLNSLITGLAIEGLIGFIVGMIF